MEAFFKWTFPIFCLCSVGFSSHLGVGPTIRTFGNSNGLFALRSWHPPSAQSSRCTDASVIFAAWHLPLAVLQWLRSHMLFHSNSMLELQQVTNLVASEGSMLWKPRNTFGTLQLSNLKRWQPNGDYHVPPGTSQICYVRYSLSF